MKKGLPCTGTSTIMAYLLGNSPTSIRADDITAVLTFIWQEHWWEIFLKNLKLFEILLNFLLGASCHWRRLWREIFGHHRSVLWMALEHLDSKAPNRYEQTRECYSQQSSLYLW